MFSVVLRGILIAFALLSAGLPTSQAVAEDVNSVLKHKDKTEAGFLAPCDGDCQKKRTLEMQIKKQQCEADKVAHECHKVENQEDVIDCDAETMFSDEARESLTEICLKESFDFFKGVVVTSKELLKMAWLKTEDDARYYSREVYRSCKKREAEVKAVRAENRKGSKKAEPSEKALTVTRNCKERLLEKHPTLRARYGESLEDEDYDTIRQDVHKQLTIEESQKSSLAKFLKKHKGHYREHLKNGAKAYLEDKKIKWYCYKTEVYKRYFCDGVIAVATGGAGYMVKKAVGHAIENAAEKYTLKKIAEQDPELINEALGEREADRILREQRERDLAVGRQPREDHPYVLVEPERQNIRTVTLPSVVAKPTEQKAIRIREVNDEGEKKIVVENRVQTEDGEWVRDRQELQIDELTGLIDGNFPSGRAAFEHLIAAQAGKAHFAFMDVGNLRAVSETFLGGKKAGDAYLKGVTDKILELGKNKITLVRLGGDEFGLIVHEKDPLKVKALLEKIQKEIRKAEPKKKMGATPKKVFRDEKKARADAYDVAAYKAEIKRINDDKSLTPEAREAAKVAVRAKAREEFQELARIQQPDVSFGVTQIGAQDRLDELLIRAEVPAKEMKIETALKFGRDVKKYGSNREPLTKLDRKKEKLVPALDRRTVSVIPDVVESPSWADAVPTVKPPAWDTLPAINLHREKTIKSYGEVSLATYTDDLGRKTVRLERWKDVTRPRAKANAETTAEVSPESKAARRIPVSYEIPMRGSSRLLDGWHPEARHMIMTHLAGDPRNTMAMLKLRSLKYANYFQTGTQAGDVMLDAVAEAAKEVTRDKDLLFKLKGNEYLFNFENMTPENLQKVVERINENLRKNPKVQKLLRDERDHLNEQLRMAREIGDSAREKEVMTLLENPHLYEVKIDVQSLNFQDLEGKNSFEEAMDLFKAKFDALDAADEARQRANDQL